MCSHFLRVWTCNALLDWMNRCTARFAGLSGNSTPVRGQCTKRSSAILFLHDQWGGLTLRERVSKVCSMLTYLWPFTPTHDARLNKNPWYKNLPGMSSHHGGFNQESGRWWIRLTPADLKWINHHRLQKARGRFHLPELRRADVQQ